ncbi:MAG: phosphatidylglycerophosphatase A [Alphaproteobacteria bacterium]|nr:phosphatidylglycerophosphatase A [Alphaproteobacteria bacterium]
MVPYPMPGHEAVARSPLPARLASLGPIGGFPWVAGAAASAAALPPAWALAALGGPALVLAGSLVLLGCAAWSIGQSDPDWDDTRCIVIDEAFGQTVALVPLFAFVKHAGPAWIAAAFVLFRVLIMARPWPLNRLRSLRPRWLGLLADDLLCGLAAGLVLAGAARLPG